MPHSQGDLTGYSPAACRAHRAARSCLWDWELCRPPEGFGLQSCLACQLRRVRPARPQPRPRAFFKGTLKRFKNFQPPQPKLTPVWSGKIQLADPNHRLKKLKVPSHPQTRTGTSGPYASNASRPKTSSLEPDPAQRLEP